MTSESPPHGTSKMQASSVDYLWELTMAMRLSGRKLVPGAQIGSPNRCGRHSWKGHAAYKHHIPPTQQTVSWSRSALPATKVGRRWESAEYRSTQRCPFPNLLPHDLADTTQDHIRADSRRGLSGIPTPDAKHTQGLTSSTPAILSPPTIGAAFAFSPPGSCNPATSSDKRP